MPTRLSVQIDSALRRWHAKPAKDGDPWADAEQWAALVELVRPRVTGSMTPRDIERTIRRAGISKELVLNVIAAGEGTGWRWAEGRWWSIVPALTLTPVAPKPAVVRAVQRRVAKQREAEGQLELWGRTG